VRLAQVFDCGDDRRAIRDFDANPVIGRDEPNGEPGLSVPDDVGCELRGGQDYVVEGRRPGEGVFDETPHGLGRMRLGLEVSLQWHGVHVISKR
jgi:hypothetical protein